MNISAKIKPWAHQAVGYDRAVEQRHILLGMDMGSGKSAIVCWLAATEGMKKILITCPLSVVGIWPKQFDLHCPEQVRVVPLGKGSIKKRAEIARTNLIVPCNRPVVIVMNHECSWRDPTSPRTLIVLWVQALGGILC